MSEAYLKVDNLQFAYEKTPVLSHISFEVEAGEFVVLTGENGAAKSTLLKNILGLLKPKAGRVQLAKKNIQGTKMITGYIPQQIASFNVGFPSTVLEFVQSGRYPRGKWFRPLNKKDHKHVEKALRSVGMWDLRQRKIGALSGGQKQRVCLARLFALDPDLLILDEPTTGMDDETRHRFYELLAHSAHEHQKAILMVTHDYDEIKPYIDRQIHLVRREDCPWRCFHMDS